MDVNQEAINSISGKEPEELVKEIERLRSIIIEQEKLASIGQLTAGILHEIKNPLNFMINFSKISAGMAVELREILDKPVTGWTEDDKDDLADICSNLNLNLTKINENGARAMRIIMSMLAQSRNGANETFELTDINQLVDDFTKLAYQGIRADNSAFNLSLKKDFDKNIGKVYIDAHDMGRAILNIVNNACYAMNQKTILADNTYRPVLTLSTSLTTTGFTISIRDNGTGMPPEVKDKIFNPFFTTKPSGEGTGLGLSMTYDIITKIHKGTLEVNTSNNEFTEFVINIPTKSIN